MPGSCAWGQPVGRYGAFLRNMVAIFFVAFYAMNTVAMSCFDDKNLGFLSQQQPQGALVYVWSPRMVLSAQHAASAQRQARQQGLAFVPLHDAQVGYGEIQAALTKLASATEPQWVASAQALANSQSLCASELQARDALRHFPTAFVLQGGALHRHAIIGAMPETAWANSIAQRLHSGEERP